MGIGMTKHNLETDDINSNILEPCFRELRPKNSSRHHILQDKRFVINLGGAPCLAWVEPWGLSRLSVSEFSHLLQHFMAKEEEITIKWRQKKKSWDSLPSHYRTPNDFFVNQRTTETFPFHLTPTTFVHLSPKRFNWTSPIILFSPIHPKYSTVCTPPSETNLIKDSYGGVEILPKRRGAHAFQGNMINHIHKILTPQVIPLWLAEDASTSCSLIGGSGHKECH